MSNRARAAALLCVSLGLMTCLGLAGCEDSNSNTDEAKVAMSKSDTFSPPSLVMASGKTVQWINNDDNPHSVTADALNAVAGGPDSDSEFPTGVPSGNSYTWTVPSAPSGTRFFYHCRFAGAEDGGTNFGTGMSGLVTIE